MPQFVIEFYFISYIFLIIIVLLKKFDDTSELDGTCLGEKFRKLL